jgi:integrase
LIIYFAALTGLRHGEIVALRKSKFNAEARRLVAERFKTRKKGVSTTVFEPLTGAQLWALNEAGETLYPEGEFFFSDKGKIHNRTYDVLETACGTLDIPYGAKTPGGLVIHDLRHTFITIMEHGSIDSSTTRSFSGHTKDSMLKHYAHATPESRARAMQVIEREVSLNRNGNGHKNGDEYDETELKMLFEAARSGAIDYEEFKKQVEFVCRFCA